MNLSLVSAPAELPVSVEDAKFHMRVDNEVEDDYIEELIEAATGAIDGSDGWLGRAIVTQTWDLILDSFPSGRICLPLPPLQSVDKLFYTDADGVEQEVTVSDTEYRVVTGTEPGFIEPLTNWPAAKTLDASVRIRFTAGYPEVPKLIRSYIKIMVSELYMNREMTVLNTSIAEVPHIRNMLENLRYRA